MKKLFTILALLMAFTVSGVAKVITIYVHAENQPYIYSWGESNYYCGDWPGAAMSWAYYTSGKNMWKYSITTKTEEESINFLFHNGNGDQTGDIKDVTGDVYYDYDGTSSYTQLANTSIESVMLPGSFNNWNQSFAMTKGEGNVWTGEIDLSESTADAIFKLIVNGAGGKTDWLGYSTSTGISFVCPDGWLVDDGTDNHNIMITNSTTGYQTYTVTAKWDENPFFSSGWTVSIEGKDKRPAYDEIGLTLTDGAHLLASEFDSYADDLKVKLTISNNTDPYESRNEYGLGQISNIDNWSATDYSIALTGKDGKEFDIFTTIGDLKKAAKNGTDSYVPGQYHPDGGVTIQVYNDCSLKSVKVLIPTIASVKLFGAWDSWADGLTMTKSTDVYEWTGTLDLTNTVENQEFKLVIDGEKWLGSNQLELAQGTENIVAVGTEGSNLTLKNNDTEYATYDVTATWTISNDVAAGWTLAITGKDKREQEYYVYLGQSSNIDNTWELVTDKMTPEVSHYTYTFEGDHSGDYFAIAPVNALNADKSDVAHPEKLIRPNSNGNFWVNFESYQDITTTGGSNVWFITSENKSEITLKYLPGLTMFSIDCAEDFTIGQYGYSTYSRAQKYKVEGATANFVTVSGNQATLVPQEASAVLPAMTGAGKGAGIILSGEPNAKVTIKSVLASSEAVDHSDNLLAGSGDNSYDIGTQFADGDLYTAYIFAKPEGKEVGFYLLDTTLGATLAAHKAFLAVPGASSAPFLGFGEGEGTTGIGLTPTLSEGEGAYYTLDGRRVEKPTKGLYIVNGKKVLVP